MKLPWYRWWPEDFAGDLRVRLMSWQAQAAYRVLLDASWGLGPLSDPEGVLEALGLPRELWAAVRPCWTEAEGGWINKRLEEERKDALKRHRRAVKASEAAAERRSETDT